MRQYELKRRASQAAKTRASILKAARQLFLRADFHEVSIDAIAKRAGVGRTTVFEQFDTKKALLSAAVLEVAIDAGLEELMAGLASPDPKRALRAAIEGGTHVWAAEAKMFRRLDALALNDAALRKVLDEKAEHRFRNIDALVERLHAAKLLTVPVPLARELFGAVTSFGAFDALYARNHSPVETAKVLLQLTRAFVRFD